MILGLLLAIGCGVSWGLCYAPMRILKQWEWENIYAFFAFFGLFLGPLVVAFATVPHYIIVNQTAGAGLVAFMLFIGAISGASGFLYSMTIPVIGLGLATALNGGSSMAMSLLPLFVLHRKTILHPGGLFTLLGVGLSVIGISLCGKGGALREKESPTPETEQRKQSRGLNFWKSVLACCIAGALSSGMNVVLAFPNPIFDIARKFGSNDFGAANAFVTPYLVGGFVTNIVYAGRLLYARQTFSRYLIPGAGLIRLALWSLLMGALFVFGAYSYAGAIGLLGSLGAVITWGVSMATMILTSSIWDMSLGEWRGEPLRIMAIGIFVLMIAIVALSFAEYFHELESGSYLLPGVSISCA